VAESESQFLVDPTDLTCAACGATFGLSEARVQKALHTRRPADAEFAKLCWVCVRLRKSVEAETAAEAKGWGCEA
jgi:hypothetical protein